jgi:predicted short-subunit dehydrogenase-like oxidoreductase (DUF2520 family)
MPQLYEPIAVCIAGAGNLGTHLATAFLGESIRVTQIISRNIDHARVLASACKAGFNNTFENIPHDTQFLLLTVPDDHIESCCNAIRDFKGVVVHCSGSAPMAALRSAPNHGVMYPLQTFSKNRKLYLKPVPFFLEASNDDTLQHLKQLAACYSENIWEADSRMRQKIHLSAVLSNNFINHLLTYSEELLQEAGLPFEILHPLLKETIEKAMLLGPTQAQTGPANRRDLKTLDAHRALLSEKKEMLDYYQLITKLIQHHGKEHKF